MSIYPSIVVVGSPLVAIAKEALCRPEGIIKRLIKTLVARDLSLPSVHRQDLPGDMKVEMNAV